MSDRGVQYERLTAHELDPLAVVAQCLDDQWVPRTLLAEMVSRNQSLDDVDDVRNGLVRGEYFRALLTARQVVINRGFLYNNPSIARDFLTDGAGRKAFVRLLQSRAVVPYLFNESSPTEQPPFSVPENSFGAWSEACRQAGQVSCLRLSWDDDRNRELTDNLGSTFHNFASSAFVRGRGTKIEEFGRHLELGPEQYQEFSGRLRALRNFANTMEDDGKIVTRSDIYRQFIVPDGEDPRSGRCDHRKPFSAELKQLIDLQYNTSLPEHLDRLPLRPTDTLHRAALREPVPTRPDRSRSSVEDLAKRLQTRIAFDAMSDALDPLDTPYLLDLDLAAVARVRETVEWNEYVTQLTALIDGNEPGDFESLAEPLIESYAAVLRTLGERRRTHPWFMQRRAVLEVSGIALRVVYGRRPTYQLVGELDISAVRSLATVRFGLVNRLAEKLHAGEPDLAVDTLRLYVDDPRELIATMQRSLQQSGFGRLPTVPGISRLRPASIERDLAAGAA